MIAAMMSSEGGPPIKIGAPLGTASTTDDGSRSGSEQLSAMSPSRTALLPMTVTVLLPNTTTASFSGLTGIPGVGVSPGWITGFGVLGNGAHIVPGGIRMCPGTCLASVPVFVAGKAVQYSTGPWNGAPTTAPIAAPIAIPAASPMGSKTIPMNGLGIGVGTGAG